MMQITVKFDKEDIEKIDEIAKRHGLSRSDLIRMVVKDWLAKGGEIRL